METDNNKKEKNKTVPKMKLSAVMVAHYFSLIWRSGLFLTFFIIWIRNLTVGEKGIINHIEENTTLIIIFWFLFTIEMTFRFFPSKVRSPGCQKQFARNYIKTGRTEIIIQDNHATVLVALIWIGGNVLIGALNMIGIVSNDFMILLSSAFSVCDIICILFFCPFQTFLLKNRCCATCRIYNWDFAMMFTPLFFVPAPYTWTLLAMSGLLLIRWEITFWRHPERFSDNTNDFITCKNCTEKLCRHKRQLKGLWQKIDASAKKKLQKLLK